MDSTENAQGAALELIDLNQWLRRQLEIWDDWAAERSEDWLELETGNSQWPAAADLLMHAFTPLHRYADRVLDTAAADPPESGDGRSWSYIHDWGQRCIDRHRQAIEQLDPGDPGRLVELDTRSMGRVKARATRCLAHASTHAAWHLGGLIHLLRRAGIDPPQRSDFLYWGVDQEAQ
ncbi:MAG TPA: hypothetical protein ENO21_04230 [Firmicutes bacterium]|nr:hypothetical protein [Bacillota bacterium]